MCYFAKKKLPNKYNSPVQQFSKLVNGISSTKCSRFPALYISLQHEAAKPIFPLPVLEPGRPPPALFATLPHIVIRASSRL
jgi:hypothetical protein